MRAEQAKARANRAEHRVYFFLRFLAVAVFPIAKSSMGRSMSASAPMAALVRLGQHAIDRSLRDKIAFGVGEPHGQFPRRQGRLFQRQLDDALANIVWNAVPDAIWLGMSVVQGFRPTG